MKDMDFWNMLWYFIRLNNSYSLSAASWPPCSIVAGLEKLELCLKSLLHVISCKIQIEPKSSSANYIILTGTWSIFLRSYQAPIFDLANLILWDLNTFEMIDWNNQFNSNSGSTHLLFSILFNFHSIEWKLNRIWMEIERNWMQFEWKLNENWTTKDRNSSACQPVLMGALNRSIIIRPPFPINSIQFQVPFNYKWILNRIEKKQMSRPIN